MFSIYTVVWNVRIFTRLLTRKYIRRIVILLKTTSYQVVFRVTNILEPVNKEIGPFSQYQPFITQQNCTSSQC